MSNSEIHLDLGPEVPAVCEQPGCEAVIDRGITHVCGADPAGGNGGCGLTFCGAHLRGPNQTCERCAAGEACYPAKAETPDWTDWRLTGAAWAAWREANPDLVRQLVEKKTAELNGEGG